MTRNNTPCTYMNTNKYNKNTMLKFMKTPRNTNHNRHLSKNKLHKKMHNNLQYKAVTNLSDKNISNSTLIALSKGLSYIPSPKPAPYKQIYNSFLKYRKNMYNRYFFRHNTNTNRHPFKLPTNFTAPIPDNSNLQEYISNIYHDLKTEYEKHKEHAKPNISKDELQAVHNLKTDNDLIVKPADKGGAIVIWPRDAYLAEAYRQLNDSNHYLKLTYDPTLETLAETKRLANKLHTSDIIDNTTHKFLTIDNQARTPQLYLLPKIHKQDNPGRPIISGCGGPTVKLSQYADHLLKPLLKHIPSYIQDTTDFLRRIFSLNQDLPDNIILITFDVKSLYTNIPNDQGIQACVDMLNENNIITPELRQSVIDILSLILNKNSFTFNNEHFLQIHGTAMGSPMAPTYANIFMAILERKLLNEAPQGLIPIEWIRFIDDIFAIWTHGIEKLQIFLSYINNFHPTIKFDYTYSYKSVNFLDTTVYINPNNKLESDLYIKPTDRTLLLHQNSFHPQTCKNYIIYSQALRYRRIITDNTRLQQRLDNLLIALIHRGYKHDNIITSFNKAILYTQNELLNKTENANKTTNKPIFTTQYNSNTKYIAQILRKHWNVIENDPTLRILWPEPPIVAYQKNKSLRDTLVSAKLN